MTVILFQLVLFYGGLSLAMTGVFMLLGNLSFASSSFSGPLQIRIGVDDPATFLNIHLGWCFWLCLVVGIFAFTLGCGIIILDTFYPNLAKRLFSFKLEKKTRTRPSSDASRHDWTSEATSFKNRHYKNSAASDSVDEIVHEEVVSGHETDDTMNMENTDGNYNSIIKVESDDTLRNPTTSSKPDDSIPPSVTSSSSNLTA